MGILPNILHTPLTIELSTTVNETSLRTNAVFGKLQSIAGRIKYFSKVFEMKIEKHAAHISDGPICWCNLHNDISAAESIKFLEAIVFR